MKLDDEGVPVNWNKVALSDDDLDAMCDAVDAGNFELASRIVDVAYARLEGLREFELRCRCGTRETIQVEHSSQIYALMNEKAWALIPTQHGRIVSAVCPVCRVKSSPSFIRKLVTGLRATARREGRL